MEIIPRWRLNEHFPTAVLDSFPLLLYSQMLTTWLAVIILIIPSGRKGEKTFFPSPANPIEEQFPLFTKRIRFSHCGEK